MESPHQRRKRSVFAEKKGEIREKILGRLRVGGHYEHRAMNLCRDQRKRVGLSAPLKPLDAFDSASRLGQEAFESLAESDVAH